MKNIKLIFFIILICTSSIAFALDYTKVDPVTELRGIWLNADAIPKNKKDIQALIREYSKANINVIFPEVICRGYTIYPSKLLKRDPRFEGSIDSLPILISESHKLGIEVHPWVWVFRAGYTKDRGAILSAHPDWIELSKYGEDLSANGGLWISPVIPEARDFLLKLYCELIKNYDVDGLHLDYIRYEMQSPVQYGYNQKSRNEFNYFYGIDPIDIDSLTYNQINWIRYRERLINTFVQSVNLKLKSIKPEIKISAAVGYDTTFSRLSLMQNWQNWIDNKWIDFVTPMAYTTNDQRFTELVTLENNSINNKTILAPGIGLHVQKNSPEQTVNQIGITRQIGALGQALFASSYYSDKLSDILISSAYSNKTLLPYNNTDLSIDKLNELSINSSDEISEFYAKRARNLNAYYTYLKTPTKYIAPSNPPLILPINVVPIPNIDVQKTDCIVNIDGDISEFCWQFTPQVKISYDNLGNLAPVDTIAYLTYDNNNLYIAFKCFEPEMNKVKALIDKRDGAVFYDDSAEAFVDPGHSKRTYYHLSANTKAIQFDQKVMDPAWNGDWKTSSKLYDGYFVIKMTIPFSIFGVSCPASGTQWGLNLTRNRTTSGKLEYLCWSATYGSFHSPERFGTITFR